MTMHEDEQDDESVAYASKLLQAIDAQTPFPSIASLLELMQEAGEVFNKGNDTGRGKRTLLRRFIDESDVDLDRFPQLRDEIFAAWNELTRGQGTHWLDASHWFQVIDAYAALVRNVSILGAGKRTVGTGVTWTIASWFAVSLFRWSRDPRNKIDRLMAADQLWFLAVEGGATPYALVFDDLKARLGIETESYFALARNLMPKAGKENRDELAKAISSWCSGETKPQLGTLRERIERPLNDLGHGLLAKDFCSQVLAIRFGEALTDFGSRNECYNPGLIIRSAMAEILGALARGEAALDFIPSPRFMIGAEDYFRSVFQRDFWDRIQNDAEREQAIIASETTSLFIAGYLDSIVNTEIERPSAMVFICFATLFRYRFGPGYSLFEGLAMEAAVSSEDMAAIKALHSRRSLEHMATTPFARSKPWYAHIRKLRDAELNPLVFQDSSAAIEWAGTYRRKDRVDQWRTWGSYRRTRLMIACAYGQVELVERLLADGADLKLFSEFRGSDRGDGATALLLAVQSYSQALPMNVAVDRAGCRSAALLLLQRLAGDPDALKRATYIRNISTLSAAIDAGDAELVEALISKGASMEIGLGGDELSALYYAVNEYFKHSLYCRFGSVAAFDFFLRSGADVNVPRMIAPPLKIPGLPWLARPADAYKSLSAEMLSFGRKAAEMVFSPVPEMPSRQVGVIKRLIALDANPDQLQSNGRYPLDLADEIEQKVGDSAIRLLLEGAGARKRSI